MVGAQPPESVERVDHHNGDVAHLGHDTQRYLIHDICSVPREVTDVIFEVHILGNPVLESRTVIDEECGAHLADMTVEVLKSKDLKGDCAKETIAIPEYSNF